MTDRELLEAAAKAMGEKAPPRFYPDGSAVLLSGQRWNPLTDDGDALRLAVALGIVPYPPDPRDATDGAAAVIYKGAEEKMTVVEKSTDPYAATRRAIVRAAAEIGRAK